MSRLNGALTRASLAALRSMPVQTQVGVHERLETIGKLDHPRYDIRIDVGNQIELFRLGSCAKEPETIEWLETNLRPGECLYDVGANIGAYSLVAFHVLEERGRVVSFEPGFSTFPKLVGNVLLNGAADVVLPLSVALGERRGLTRLNYSTLLAGGAMHGFGEEPQQAQGPNPGAWTDVLTFRLDELVEEFGLEPPNLLKLDVDGAEAAVLRGAGRLLADSGLRSVLVEVDERERERTAEIVKMLTENGLELHEKRLHARSGVSNFIFLRP